MIYPGETKDHRGYTMGHLYAYRGPSSKRYEVMGGPPPGEGFKDAGGHVAESTPAGSYVLGRAEHHVTLRWPESVVAWGAELRDRDGTIEYRVGNEWKPASGANGTVTRAWIDFSARSGAHMSLAEADRRAREMFFEKGTLLPKANRNNFGPWAWNLMKNGRRTPYYLHTTPASEAATVAGTPFELSPSHGCVHLRPSDRDELVAGGFLKAGVPVDVMRYGTVGPSLTARGRW